MKRGLRRERRELKFKNKLRRYARWLRKRTPPAEQWFQAAWFDAGMLLDSDRFNEPFDLVIPDCHNKAFRYVIEIDEIHHNSAREREKDTKRDLMFREVHQYEVFRIPAYDDARLAEVIELVKQRRENLPHLKAIVPRRYRPDPRIEKPEPLPTPIAFVPRVIVRKKA